ncbi:MAG: recombination-associated protein RdgC [Porticoccaceae bacterium]|nr:MAG: recombination-associated protein RdgC [Porticoccaceae bacterium]
MGRDSTALVHAVAGRPLFCLERRERVLPAAVVREALAERVAAIEASEGRAVGRRERAELREQVVFELLPRAFTRAQRLFAWIEPRQGLLLVGSPSPRRAEELLATLREALGSLPLGRLETVHAPAEVMTRWLAQGSLPKGFAPGGECELRDRAEAASTIRVRNRDLLAAELRSHLAEGMAVTRLALLWEGGVEFVLGADLSLKRLRFADELAERAERCEDPRAQLDADFALWSGVLAELLAALLPLFGGAAEPAQAA